jgi:hypothetical protein
VPLLAAQAPLTFEIPARARPCAELRRDRDEHDRRVGQLADQVRATRCESSARMGIPRGYAYRRPEALDEGSGGVKTDAGSGGDGRCGALSCTAGGIARCS